MIGSTAIHLTGLTKKNDSKTEDCDVDSDNNWRTDYISGHARRVHGICSLHSYLMEDVKKSSSNHQTTSSKVDKTTRCKSKWLVTQSSLGQFAIAALKHWQEPSQACKGQRTRHLRNPWRISKVYKFLWMLVSGLFAVTDCLKRTVLVVEWYVMFLCFDVNERKLVRLSWSNSFDRPT